MSTLERRRIVRRDGHVSHREACSLGCILVLEEWGVGREVSGYPLIFWVSNLMLVGCINGGGVSVAVFGQALNDDDNANSMMTIMLPHQTLVWWILWMYGTGTRMYAGRGMSWETSSA